MVPGVSGWRLPSIRGGRGMIAHSSPWIGEREIDAVVNVLQSGMLVGGDRGGEFSHALKKFTGGRQEVALFSSGRAAISAALKALDLPLCSSIVVQSYVCEAVLWAIRDAGHRPVLCDIGEGWVANVEQMEAKFTSDCQAIILAPPFGFRQTATDFRRFRVPIVHDLCQASPQTLIDTSSEAIGDIVSFSFHPTKYLCAGGGGAAIEMTGRYGKNLRELERVCCGPAPFSDIQAAIGLIQLERIEEFKAGRAKLYDLYLAGVHKSLTARLRKSIDVPSGAMFRFPLDLSQGEAKDLFPVLANFGITARHGVDQPAHRVLGLDDRLFPNTVRAFEKTISPPFYPALGESDARLVADRIAALQ